MGRSEALNEQSNIRLLLVDDKNLTMSLDRAGYREMGVQVYTAQDAQSIQETIKNKEIEIILLNYDYLDDKLPMICKSIKTIEEFKDIPIIVTSVQTNAQKIADACGANLFVNQPIPRSYLIEKIKEILSKEIRNNDRVVTDTLHEVDLEYDGKRKNYSIIDISKSGLLIETEEIFNSSETCKIIIKLPQYKKSLSIDGLIVRSVEKDPSKFQNRSGVGIRFLNLKDETKRKLYKFLESYSTHQEIEKMKYYL